MSDTLIIHKLFSESASCFPDKVALRIKRDSQWQEFSYKEVESLSQRVATFLLKEAFRKNDFAALILENRPEWAIIYLGIMYAGLACVPLDPQLNPQEIENLIIDSGAKIIFCSEHIFQEKIKPNKEKYPVKFVVVDNPDYPAQGIVSFSAIENIAPEPSLFPVVTPQDVASLIYTSGTTGRPKGVLLTHKNICANFFSLKELNLCLSSDNVLSLLPLYHTYAFMVTLIVPILLGAEITYALNFKPADLTSIIKEARVSFLVGVPQLFLLVHKAISDQLKKIPLFLRILLQPVINSRVRSRFGKNLRFLVSGGARLEPKIARDLSRWMKARLIEGYGLTETSPVVTLNPPRRVKFGSVGIPIPDVEIKILNPDKSGIGEVLIKGPNLMQGYFKRDDLTAQVIKDGWFYSGDLGYLDKEGYLYLVGRQKEVIVLSSGKNIYPEELEEYYSQCPYIKEICIVSKKEERFGRPIESLSAVIVPNLEYFRQRNESDIRGKLRWELENLSRNLPSYKHIMGFTIIKEELPRTALKKIKRYEVRQQYLQEEAPQPEPKTQELKPEDLGALNKELAEKVIHYLSRELKKPVSLDSHLEIDLGVDSLTRVQLGLGLEALLKLKIPDEALFSISTIREVIAKLEDLLVATPSLTEVKQIQKTWSEILNEPPQETIVKRIKLKPSLLEILSVAVFKSAILFMFRIFWRLSIKGKKLLPQDGPYIICPNHASYLDGLFVASSLPLKIALKTFFIGYSEIFESPAVSWAIKVARLIPIDVNVHLTETMQAISFVLRQQKIVCFFPEGRRSIDENLGEFKKGVGILIKELDIPVVPVYIKGSHYSWPRGSRFPHFYPIKVIFGRPVSLKELLRAAKDAECADDYEAIAKGLRKKVLKLAC